MASPPPKAVQDRWRAWVEQTLGGDSAQIELATRAAIQAVTAHAPQESVVRAAQMAWRGEAAEIPLPTTTVPSQTPRGLQPIPSQAAKATPTPASQQHVPMASRPGWVRGRVMGFQPRNQLQGRRYVTIWSFRVEQSGGRPPVALEMRGYAFDGSIASGDEVEVEATSGKHGIQRVTSLENLSSNSTVRVTKKPGSGLAGILVFLSVVAIAVAVANVVFPASQLPGWVPGSTMGEGDFHDTAIAVPFFLVGLGLFAVSRIIKRFSR